MDAQQHKHYVAHRAKMTFKIEERERGARLGFFPVDAKSWRSSRTGQNTKRSLTFVPTRNSDPAYRKSIWPEGKTVGAHNRCRERVVEVATVAAKVKRVRKPKVAAVVEGMKKPRAKKVTA
jgi:hypothetical protein